MLQAYLKGKLLMMAEAFALCERPHFGLTVEF